jgi:hypothetical protein
MSRTTGKLPKPVLLTIYLCAVLVLGTVNWAAINFENSKEKIHDLESGLNDSLINESATLLQPEDSKLDLTTNHLTSAKDWDIHVETWMLQPDWYNFADSSVEKEQIADWMLSSIGWTCCELLARR